MLKVRRYINGKPISDEEMDHIVIDSDAIWAIIDGVNRRIRLSQQMECGVDLGAESDNPDESDS